MEFSMTLTFAFAIGFGVGSTAATCGDAFAGQSFSPAIGLIRPAIIYIKER